MSGRLMAEPCIDCGETGHRYQGLGRCTTCYSRMSRRADPGRRERDRQASLRWKREHRDLARAYDRTRFLLMMQPCPGCDGAMTEKASLCEDCIKKAAVVKASLLEGMWLDGWTIKEIAAAIGTTTGSVMAMMAKMRSDGWHLPHRYRMDGKRRISAKVT